MFLHEIFKTEKMKKALLCLALTAALLPLLRAQTATQLRVYQIFQQKCASCHDHASPEAGLDLEGAGATEAARAQSVYNNLYLKTPANTYAAGKGYKYIYPGRPDRSFLFRKINNGLETTIQLHAQEMQPMPADNQPALTDVEKELIRQWVLYGAPATGEVVSEALLTNYYNNGGLRAFPAGAPEAPAPDEGFQLKMGPFYLPPGGELEYFLKHELDLPENLEVTRLEIMMGSYSHHFIIYDFMPGGSTGIPAGYRLNADHSNISLVAAVQESIDLDLPKGTAFPWDKDLVLDLNSHYINYSSVLPYQAEAYVNIYTQPHGTAIQEMHTQLIPNYNIPIPNNGDLITHSQTININFGEIFVWGIMGHTHKYGTGYKVFKRLPGGQKGELIYDASCPLGIPGCVSPFFNYQHIPMRYFSPLAPLTIDSNHGLIQEATWMNDGPASVNFGPTSNDEMMVMVAMFTTDTTGLVNAVSTPADRLAPVQVIPNPVLDGAYFHLDPGIRGATLSVYDSSGRRVGAPEALTDQTYYFERKNLPAGLYIYRITDRDGRWTTGKMILR